MTDPWKDVLSAEQRAAASAGARLVEDADLRFVMLLFAEDGRGAVIGNIDPARSVRMIEQALAAAKAGVRISLIEEERLQ